MHAFPHFYQASVVADPDNPLTTSCKQFPNIAVSPPVEFGGSGEQWSPEELLMASVANCLVLSFRAIAKMAEYEWLNIQCESRGELDKVERKIVFTKVYTKATLTLHSEADIEKAKALLNKAEQACFITNSLSSESFFECDIVMSD